MKRLTWVLVCAVGELLLLTQTGSHMVGADVLGGVSGGQKVVSPTPTDPGTGTGTGTGTAGPVQDCTEGKNTQTACNACPKGATSLCATGTSNFTCQTFKGFGSNCSACIQSTNNCGGNNLNFPYPNCQGPPTQGGPCTATYTSTASAPCSKPCP